jgi:hypothetical protein
MAKEKFEHDVSPAPAGKALSKDDEIEALKANLAAAQVKIDLLTPKPAGPPAPPPVYKVYVAKNAVGIVMNCGQIGSVKIGAIISEQNNDIEGLRRQGVILEELIVPKQG